ncbi:MAG: HNH endonuclease [Hymenobacter sp.]|nr:MAG: HNH endonuclease [Hymenobacter sp.]
MQRLSELTPKPKHSPVPTKWKQKGGRIDVLEDGNWKYTDWEGNTVVYNGDEPNFNPHQRQQVDIENMEGNCTSDFAEADEKAPLGPILDENTWHHKNNLKTMQEVPTDVHQRFTHYGARSIIKKNAATPVKKAVIRKRKS